MAKKQKFQEKRYQNKNGDADTQKERVANILSTAFTLDIYRYFYSLPNIVNIDTNLDQGTTPFFTIENGVPNWFGNTICFDYRSYSFRLYFAFQFNTKLPSINELIVKGGKKEGWPPDVEPKRLYHYLSNLWIQLNISKSYEPFDGANSEFIVRYDASPHHPSVKVFPWHKHLYEKNNGLEAIEFDGSRDQLLEELQDMIETITFDFEKKT